MWTREAVEKRLRDAAQTLRCLPDRDRAYLSPLRCIWPAYPQVDHDEQFTVKLQQLMQSIENAEKTKTRLRVVDPAEIPRMEECWVWLRSIVMPKRRVVVWLRAAGLPVKKVGRQVGLDRRSVWWHYSKGIEEIVDALNLVRKASNG